MEVADRLTLTIPFGERIQILIAIEVRRKISCVEWSIDSMETGTDNDLWCKNFRRPKEFKKTGLKFRNSESSACIMNYVWICHLIESWLGMVELGSKFLKNNFLLNVDKWLKLGTGLKGDNLITIELTEGRKNLIRLRERYRLMLSLDYRFVHPKEKQRTSTE